jgi:hypothetical protein
MKLKLFCLIFLSMSAYTLSAKDDSICGIPLKYQVLHSNEPTEGFFWIAGDKRYNVYFKGADFILEHKKSKELWVIAGSTYNAYPGTEMFIDTVYLRNTSESREKELVIEYSLSSMKPDDSGKSRHMAIIDIKDKYILLNIALYDYRLQKDENGKYMEYLYECDIDVFHDGIRITTTDDSDINDARIQLDDGVYFRKGHCFVLHK